MNVELKKLVVNGKALTLKVINQLQLLELNRIDGYYIIKERKKYIYLDHGELFYSFDANWEKSKGFKHSLYDSSRNALR